MTAKERGKVRAKNRYLVVKTEQKVFEIYADSKIKAIEIVEQHKYVPAANSSEDSLTSWIPPKPLISYRAVKF